MRGLELWGIIKSSYVSRTCLQKTRARLTGCAIDTWIGACPTGISFQVLVFSFHSLYLTAQQVDGKGNENPKEQRPLPPSVLRSGSTGSAITSPLACAVGGTIPAVPTLGSFATGQVFGSVLLGRPSLGSLLGDPCTILREYRVVCWHLLWAQ